MDPTRPRLTFRSQADFPNSFPAKHPHEILEPENTRRQHWYRDLCSIVKPKPETVRVLLSFHPTQTCDQRQPLGVCGRTGSVAGNTESLGWIEITAMPERRIG